MLSTIAFGLFLTLRLQGINPKPTLQFQVAPTGPFEACQFCRGGRSLLTVSRTETALIDTESGLKIRSWAGGEHEAISSDESRLVVSIGTHVTLLDLVTGSLITECQGHTAPVTGITFLSDGKFFATCSMDETVRIWLASDGSKAYLLDQRKTEPADNQPIEEVRLAPDGRSLVTRSPNFLSRWDFVTQNQLWRVPCSPKAKLSDTGNWAADFSEAIAPNKSDNKILIIDMNSGKVSGSNSISSPESSLTWFDHDKRLAVGTESGQILIYSRDVKQFQTLGRENSPISDAIVSEGSDMIAIRGAGSENTSLWSLRNSNPIRTDLPGFAKSFAPDGRRLAIESGRLTLAATGKRPPTKLEKDAPAFVGPGPLQIFGNEYDDRTLGSAFDQASCLGGSAINGNLAIGVRSRVFIFKADGTSFSFDATKAWVLSTEFSADGKQLVTTGLNGSVVITNVETRIAGTPLYPAGPGSPVYRARFSPTTAEILIASGNKVSLCGATDGHILQEFSGLTGAHDALWLSNGRVLGVGDAGLAMIWDQTGQVLGRIRIEPQRAAYARTETYSLSGSRVAVIDPGATSSTIYDIESCKPIRTVQFKAERYFWAGMELYDSIAELRLSPDSGTLFLRGKSGASFRYSVYSGIASSADPAQTMSVEPCGPKLGAHLTGDGLVELVDLAGRRAVRATMAIRLPKVGPVDWWIADAEGRFDAADVEDSVGIHWLMPTQPFDPVPLEAFFQNYFQPGLFGQLVSEVSLPVVQPPASREFRTGKVKIWGGIKNGDGTNHLVFDVTSEVPISRITILRNRKVFQEIENPEKLAHGGKARFDIVVLSDPSSPQRPAGGWSEEFSVYTFNGGGIKGPTETTQWGSYTPSHFGRAYVVTIGINSYANPRWNLAYAASDAREMRLATSAAIAQNKIYSDVVSVELVSDEKRMVATKDNIRKVFSILAGTSSPSSIPGVSGAERLAKVRPEDAVLISWAGHGFMDPKGVYYLVPSDIPEVGHVDSPSFIERCVSAEEVSIWLRPIDCSEMALILDTCQSAGVVQGKDFKPGPSNSRSFGQLSYDHGIRVLAATQAANVAIEDGQHAHGLLTFALLEGLQKEVAFKGSSTLDLRSWLDFAVGRVPELYLDMRTNKLRTVLGREAVEATEAVGFEPAAGQRPTLFDYVRIERSVPLFGRAPRY